jgi:hypothetical protein
MCSTALAEGETKKSATAHVTKLLQMPALTETPEAEFEFEVTKVSVDGKTSEVTSVPDLTIASISFNKNDTGTSEGTTKTVKKTSDLVFEAFPHAGIYTYRVTEKADTVTAGTGQKFVYSGAEYQVDVYVVNATNDPKDSTLYIANIVLTQIKNDAGELISSQTKAGSSTSDGSVIQDGIGDNFCFTNKYAKKAAGSDGNGPLRVEVKTSGNVSDKTKEFPVEITVTATGFEDSDFTGWTVKINRLTGETENVAIKLKSGEADTVQITSGTTATINLKSGESFEVQDLLVGSAFVVTEQEPDSYYTVTTETSVTSNVETKDNTVSGNIMDGGNVVTFTNEYLTEIITGIAISNLPFLLLIVLAGAGILLVARFGKRRERY